MIKIAFYDTKEYDIPSFTEYGKERNIEFKFFENKLDEDQKNEVLEFLHLNDFTQDSL